VEQKNKLLKRLEKTFIIKKKELKFLVAVLQSYISNFYFKGYLFIAKMLQAILKKKMNEILKNMIKFLIIEQDLSVWDKSRVISRSFTN
jgi:hypothetical protein